MKYRSLIFGWILLGLSIQAIGADRNAAVNNVVMLTTENLQSHVGFLVGQDEVKIYIATSALATWDQQSNGTKTLLAEFRVRPGESYKTQQESSSLSEDITVLSVSKGKSGELAGYALDIVLNKTMINKARVLGRLSLQELWQETPLFNMSVANESGRLVLASYFELPTFYGGPVFDDNWNLVGMAVQAKQPAGEYMQDELTDIIPVSHLVKHLTQHNIPVFKHMLTSGFQKLTDEQAFTLLPRLGMKILKEGEKNQVNFLWQPFRGKKIDNIRYTVFRYGRSKGWQQNRERTLNMSTDNLNEQIIVEQEIEQVVICHVTAVDDGFFVVGAMGLANISRNNTTSFWVNASFKEIEPLLSTIETPCSEVVESHFKVSDPSLITH